MIYLAQNNRENPEITLQRRSPGNGIIYLHHDGWRPPVHGVVGATNLLKSCMERSFMYRPVVTNALRSGITGVPRYIIICQLSM